MIEDDNERLTRLEMLAAHQTQTIEEMSAVITEQWQTIERLQRKLDTLASRFMALEEQAAPAIESAKPPHW